MPTVPLYQNGEVPAVQTGVRVPMVAQNVTAGPALGQGLVNIGQAGLQLAAHIQHANDTAQIMKASNAMDEHVAAQSLFQTQNPDQPLDSWQPEWEKRVTDMQDYSAKLNLSPKGRASLDMALGHWGKMQGFTVQNQAIKQTNSNAVTSVSTRMGIEAAKGNDDGIHSAGKFLTPLMIPDAEKEQLTQHYLNQSRGAQRDQVKNNVSAALTNSQPEVAKSWLDQGLKSGALTESEHAAQMADVGHAAEVNNLVTIANDDPRRAMELATSGEQAKRISGVERVRIVDAAQGKLNELRTTALKDYTSQIQLGVADKNKFAGKILDDSNLEPIDKANLANFLDRGPVNDPVAYASLYSEAKEKGYKEGTPEYSRFINRVDMSQNGEQQSSILAVLHDKAKAPKAMAGIYAQMSDDLAGGMFGALHGRLADPKTQLSAKDRAEVDAIRAELVTPAEQERLKTEPTRIDYLEGKAREEWYKRNHSSDSNAEKFSSHVVEDEALKHAASDRAWKAMKETESFQRTNPNATPEEVRSHYDSQLVRQRGAGDVNPLLPSIETPKVDLNAILKRHAPNSGK